MFSRYQGSINWSAVAAAGKQFAIVRIGSSNNNGAYVDPYFLQNVNLQAAQGFCRCAVDRIEDAVLFLKLGNLVVDIFSACRVRLSVLNKRFSVVQLLQLVQRRDTERCGHRL